MMMMVMTMMMMMMYKQIKQCYRCCEVLPVICWHPQSMLYMLPASFAYSLTRILLNFKGTTWPKSNRLDSVSIGRNLRRLNM